MRRSAGEGAVYQRKTGAKKGLWVAEYEAGGKRKYLYGKNKKAVTDRLKAKLSSGETDLAAEADTMLVGAYLDRWLPTVKGTIKERTWERLEVDVRFHIKPVIGGTKLLKLAPLNVQELYRSKLDSGLSPRSVQIMHATLYSAHLRHPPARPEHAPEAGVRASGPRRHHDDLEYVLPRDPLHAGQDGLGDGGFAGRR